MSWVDYPARRVDDHTTRNRDKYVFTLPVTFEITELDAPHAPNHIHMIDMRVRLGKEECQHAIRCDIDRSGVPPIPWESSLEALAEHAGEVVAAFIEDRVKDTLSAEVRKMRKKIEDRFDHRRVKGSGFMDTVLRKEELAKLHWLPSRLYDLDREYL